MPTANHPVVVRDPRVEEMNREWEVIEHLLGGTNSMRQAGQKYLPQRLMEHADDYRARLNMATLFPALAVTINNTVGRVFAGALQPDDKMPKWIEDEVLPDVDRQGRNLQVFARDWFAQAFALGLSHVLVDSPPAAGVRTRADQKAAGLRPYCIQIHPSRILGWKVREGRLVQLRVMFDREEDDGEFGTAIVPQVRVFEPGLIRVFEEDAKTKDWIQKEEIKSTLDFIPIVTFYTWRTGILTAKPPLIELAHLNAKHWAHQSSNDALLETASVPILVAYGMEDEQSIVIGAKQAIKMPENGKLAYTEHTGQAITAGRDALKDLKEEMKQAGARLLDPGMGAKTATEAAEDNARENSQLGSMVFDFEDALATLIWTIAQYRGEDTEAKIKTASNLDPEFAPADSARFLLEMCSKGKLSDQTLFEEVQRRKFISSDVDWEDEQTRIEESAPPPMALNPLAPPKLGPDGLPLEEEEEEEEEQEE